MKKLLISFLMFLLPSLSMAAGGGYPLDSVDLDLTDKAALQRGAKLFVGSCMGCHSAKYQRWNRMGKDLGISDQQLLDNFIFDGSKVGDHMTSSIDPVDAATWFGASPPDLTLVSRVRGNDWLYTYMRSFYKDESRPWGVNNAVFPDVGMPHILQGLQGLADPVWRTEKVGDKEIKVLDRLQMTQPGSMSVAEYDATVKDLVTFLSYIGEPVQLERQRLGVWVILFLMVLLAFSYLLKKEFWRDVH
ncbi:cytochrome c1 [Pelagibaculum spongiae]|uniref:Cytochrome c1 n=1 Tax=Pelagibaculum spongiae TaxID=2080658 RepID=A0A2V1H539_9GAMM|nr:cytochrome c1 [Pelagibaculum spongiae]PVZ71885.1 cytochrome c1 [Pelagibaculum spongiae]